MTTKKDFKNQAEAIIQNLKKRNIDGHYFENRNDLLQYLKDTLPKGCSVTWGGSETLKETGVLDLLTNSDYITIQRSTAKTEEEQRQVYAKQVLSDYFFMSSNAITLDGELINIDGNANRVGCLVHGPRYVYLIVGMNKVVSDVESGIQRIQNIAAPPNGARLHLDTPCSTLGHCGDCLMDSCMCNQIVITRHNRHLHRIHVFLIHENLGY